MSRASRIPALCRMSCAFAVGKPASQAGHLAVPLAFGGGQNEQTKGHFQLGGNQ